MKHFSNHFSLWKKYFFAKRFRVGTVILTLFLLLGLLLSAQSAQAAKGDPARAGDVNPIPVLQVDTATFTATATLTPTATSSSTFTPSRILLQCNASFMNWLGSSCSRAFTIRLR